MWQASWVGIPGQVLVRHPRPLDFGSLIGFESRLCIIIHRVGAIPSMYRSDISSLGVHLFKGLMCEEVFQNDYVCSEFMQISHKQHS